MPSASDFQELFNNTTMSVVDVDNVTCYKFTAENGKYILLPATGIILGSNKQNPTFVYLWTRDISGTQNAYSTLINISSVALSRNVLRAYGVCIRPIFRQQE